MTGELAGVIISVSFMVTTAAVVLLWPITRRLGAYLEVLVQEKRSVARLETNERVEQLLEEVSQRLALLEERVEFAER
ncbi:MAG: hypothetical protein FWJ74_10235, partial [Gemmatimonadota bacterium]